MAGSAALDAYWLPGLDPAELTFQERAFGPGDVALRVPLLNPAQLGVALDTVVEARLRTLVDRPLDEILAAVDEAAASMTASSGPHRAELVKTLPALTGYSRQMIEIGLERMGAGWRADALRAAIEDEFGDPGVLDGFRPRAAGGRHRAFGPDLAVHFFSGNIPGVAVSSIIRALCVKSASLGKTAAGEPYLAVRFAQALSEVDPGLGACLAVTYWPGGEEELEAVAFSRAGAVIAYGGDDTVAEIRRRVAPHARFLAYPNRIGAALLTRSALSRADAVKLARAAATDVITFDQQGCVSPHVLFVERGAEVDAVEFGEQLSRALADLAEKVPRRKISAGESTSIHQLRAQAEMRGAHVWASASGTDWTVIHEERSDFELSPLNRVVHVRVVQDLEDAVAALSPLAVHLQTVAVSGHEEEVADIAGRLGELGATRVVPVGQAAWPAPHWHHDGRFQFLDLVRFTDLETA